MRAEENIQELSTNGRTRPEVNDGLSPDEPTDSQAKQKGLNLGSFARIARRNALLISGTTIAATGIAALTTLGAPSYLGNFTILVEPITSQARSTDPSAISRREGGGGGEVAADTVDYPTLLQVLQSPEILSKIADEIKPRYPDVTAESLRQEITDRNLVVRRPGENLLEVAKVVEVVYQGGNPQRVQYILEKLAEGYLKFSLEYRKSRIGGGVQFIEDQLPSLQQRVNNLEGEMQALKQRYRITDPASESAAIAEQLRTTRTERLAAQRDLAEQRTLYANLQRRLGLTPDEALAAASLSENPRYQALLTQLKTVEAQIAVKSARYTDDSHVTRALSDQKDNLIKLLDQEARENLVASSGTGPNPRILAFQNPTRVELIRQYMVSTNATQQLQVRNQAANQAEAFLNQRLQQFPLISRQYNTLQQQLDIATRTLNQFLTQRETLRIEAAQKELPWEVISPPTLAKDAAGNPQPAPTKSTRNLGMGVVGGLLLGFILAMLREKRKDIFFDLEDLKGAVQLPMLGVIPFRESSNLIMNPLAGNSDTFSKAFNSLCTNIRFLSSNPSLRSLVVGSASIGDGKTTIALNLALAAAASGQRVLLVDSNLRTPRLHNLPGLANSVGFSEMLTGRAHLEQAIQRSSLDKNLSIVTAGQALSDALRLLAASSMKKLTQDLQGNFDLVIYDTPDLSEFSDTTFLAAQADGVVMAVGVGATKRSALTQALAELSKFQLPVLGVIANHTARTVTASYAKARKSQQDHESQPAILEDLGILKPGLPTSTKQ